VTRGRAGEAEAARPTNRTAAAPFRPDRHRPAQYIPGMPPRERLLVRVGALGTLAAGLVALGAAVLLVVQSATGTGGSGPGGAVMIGVALLPLLLGLVLLRAGLLQLRLRDDEMAAPKTVAVLLIAPLGILGTILSGNDDGIGADVGGDLVRGILLLAGVLVLLGLSAMASTVLHREAARRR
jgi:hypothetical protein